MKADIKDLLSLIQQEKRVLLFTHLRPDGDAIGSVLALSALLRRLGKETIVLCQDPVPENLRFLPGWEEVRSAAAFEALALEAPYALGIAADASDFARLGDCGPYFKACRTTIKIDHHATNEQFAGVNYVDDEAAATGVLIGRLYEALAVPLDEDAALCLYAALSTDTGNFSFGRMTEEFFVQLARCMKAGLPIDEAARKLHLVKHPVFIWLLTRALQSLTYLADGRLTVMQLRDTDMVSPDAAEFAEGIVNYGLNIVGVEMTFLATQMPDGVKFSLRCLPPHDVSKAGAHFGGGGHVLAAGCTIDKPMDEAVSMMRSYLEGMLS